MSDVEVFAARANMTRIIGMLHDPASRLMDALMRALKDGKLCVVDVSQLRGGPSLILSGLILRRIFDRNQEEFTKDNPQSIPTIAVLEEAQSVLNERSSASQPYIEWVKEGRKYDLGAMLITQQPGSIPGEILSQGDNWFIFHLLSAADLRCVKSANAHYSDDLLSSLLNEPIPGHGVFWSSVSGRPFPISFRAVLFEKLYGTMDPKYESAAVDTYARRLRQQLKGEVQRVLQAGAPQAEVEDNAEELGVAADPTSTPADFRKLAKRQAIEALRNDGGFKESFDRNGIPWGIVIQKLKESMPETIQDRDDFAHSIVVEAMETIIGPKDEAWHTTRRAAKSTGREMTWIVKGPNPQPGTA
jgi:hypothetical protein